MTRKIFTLFFVFAAFVSANAQKEIPFAAKAPVIDGYIDDAEDGWGTFVDLTARNPAGTTTAMTAKSCLMAGTDAFYYALVVQDATPNNDATAIANSYERDNNEIFFSLDTVTKEDKSYKPGCWQIRTQREGETLNDGGSGSTNFTVATLIADANFQVGVETSATEWSVELKLPYSQLEGDMDPVWDRKFIRFENAAADNTTGAASGRTEQRYWNDIAKDDNAWHNTSEMTIYKMPKEVSGEVSAKNVNSAKASAFVSNNVLNVKNINGAVNIYDVKGTLVRKSVINGNGSIAISDLKSGVYIVKSNDFAQKFVK